MRNEIKTITYLGPAGTFTEEAAFKVHNKISLQSPDQSPILEEVTSIPQALKLGKEGLRMLVVPIETTVGDVTPTLTSLLNEEYNIRGEVHIQVRYGQFSIGEAIDSSVTHFVTKPEAKGQCSNYTMAPERSHWQFKEDDPDAISSTAAAVAYVARKNDPTIVALASPTAGTSLLRAGQITEEEYARLVCKPNVGNSDQQYTKFVVLTKPGEGETPNPTGNDATSILVDIPDKPGSLDHLLESLGDLNMSAIKSLNRENGQATLFITLDGHIQEQRISSALNLLPPSYSVRSLGSYPRDPLPNIELSEEPDIANLSTDMLKLLSDHGYSNNTETAISFMLQNRPGALKEVAKILRELGVNITRLHSRPTGRFIGDYVFGITVENNTVSSEAKLLDNMLQHCTQATILSLKQVDN